MTASFTFDYHSKDESPEENRETGIWQAFEIILLVLWCPMLPFICYNMYEYLCRQRQYTFIPLVITYFSMLGVAVLMITYLSQRIRNDSKLNTTDHAWVYYAFYQRFLVFSGFFGFICLFIELIQTIKQMEEESKKLAQYVIQKQRSFT